MFGYPFMGPANRSAYTRAIHSRPDLADSLGVLQGLLVQAFTIGGIVGPLCNKVYSTRASRSGFK